MDRDSRRLFVFVLLALACASAPVFMHVRADTAHAANSAYKSIFEKKALALYPIVTGRAAGLTVFSETLELANHDGRTRRFWTADCLDEEDRPQACFVWDLTTRDLVKATRTVSPDSHGRPLEPRLAVKISAGWMRSLGITRYGSRWHPAGNPERTPAQWIVRWRDGRRRATMYLDAVSGLLIDVTAFESE